MALGIREGFTLVEIIIVITILGMLAVALLATIDPIEQSNRGLDSKTQNLVSQLDGAFDRYYNIRQEYPWGATNPSGLALSAGDTNVTTVINQGDLTANFTQLAGANLNQIFLTGTVNSKVLCFLPTSQNMAFDKNAIYTITGGAGVGCKGDSSGTNTCYWCVSSS